MFYASQSPSTGSRYPRDTRSNNNGANSERERGAARGAEESDARDGREYQAWLKTQNIKINEVQVKMNILESKLASLSDADMKDQNAIPKSKSWWKSLNPWGTAAPNDQQKQAMEQERLQRMAATRIQDNELLTFSVQLGGLQKEKDKRTKAENERQERIRTENLRREQDRRNKECQELFKRRREEERIARKQSEALRQERERQERAAMEARQKEEQEHREKDAKRRQQEEQRRKRMWEQLRKQEEDHLGYYEDRRRSQRQDAEWQETECGDNNRKKSQRSANVKGRQDWKVHMDQGLTV